MTLELVDRADVVFHLAAAVGVRLILERPVDTMPDLGRVQRLIGYAPTLALPDMLERIIAYERGARVSAGALAPAWHFR